MRSPRTRQRRRLAALAAGGAGLALALGACADTSDSGGSAAEEPASGAEQEIDCAPYKEFGDIKGKTVSVYTSIVAPEDKPHIEAFKPWEKCTGATAKYEGSKEFEAQLGVRINSGSPPDLAYLPQPGLLARLSKDTGAVVPAPEQVVKNVDENWSEDWKSYGTVDDTFLAAPLGANLKSFVWYSPTDFKDKGYEVPKTFDEMMALSDKIAETGEKPWCAGIGSGDATGWPATDWLEDVVLHEKGPEVYDQWINHDIPFNDPQIVESLGTVASVLKNDKYVNGGLGGVQSIATTEFTDAGLPILDGTCTLHRQASFYQANWPEGTKVAEDGDVFAFPFPVMNPDVGDAAVGAGEFVAAFSDRPEVASLQTYLSSAEWANIKAKVSGPGWVSSNLKLDKANLKSPIDQLVAEQFQNPDLTFRFDASDLMPAEVGSAAEWKALTDWIAKPSTPDQETADKIEAAWPQ